MRILALSDLSERSERALRRALLLAEQLDAELTVVSVVNEDLPGDISTTLEATSREKLELFCSDLTDRSFTVRVEIGDPHATSLELAQDLTPDLVVMGTHKPRAFWDMFSGTTAERIIRHLKAPVLIVAEPVAGPYRSVICGIDFSPACASAARVSTRVAPTAKATAFHALHIPFKGYTRVANNVAGLEPFMQEASKALSDWWQTEDIPSRYTPPDPLPSARFSAFQKVMNEQKADLVAVGAHTRSIFSPSHLGGFTEDLIRNPPCDLLIVRG